MSEDRSWMYDQWNTLPKTGLKEEYVIGVDHFIQHVCLRTLSSDCIRCPCTRCANTKLLELGLVKLHLLKNGFMPHYEVWTSHGEELHASPRNIEVRSDQHEETTSSHNNRDSENTFVDMIFDVAGPSFVVPSSENIQAEEPHPKAKEFFQLLKVAEEPLWPGCTGDTILSLTSKLLKMKSCHNASQALFNDMLHTFSRNLPVGHKMPANFYEAKRIVEALGLPHETIDVCINGCMLFWKEDAELVECKFCKHGRWKSRQRTTNRQGRNIPYKRLHYLPLIPRLQRLFASNETAKYMSWHAKRTSDLGIMGHPSDGDAWKAFDTQHKDFSSDPRNVRLGICIDGFQPFGQSGKKFSSWPIMVTPYNLPPWMCMKRPYIFLTLLAPGPENPKHNIDIYMQPLIDELKQLWDHGVDTYDVHSKQNFKMKAALMWTIGDFPAYAMLSGWSTAGKLACPYCMGHAGTIYLENSKKVSFFDVHRKFLPMDHRYRKNKKNFMRNRMVHDPPPPQLNGHQVWDKVKYLPKMVDTGGVVKNLPGKSVCHNWVKQSIFWELPYWRSNMIRHNLDAMHIVRNVFCNVFYTVMDTKGKTKENGPSREDVKLHCNRKELHIPEGCITKPLARYELDKERKRALLDWVKTLKFPDEYCSNLSRCVDYNALTLSGMKSHDCHVFMMRLLPIAFRELLPEPVWSMITELSIFFNDLTSPILNKKHVEHVDERMALVLCNLEQIFPPAFFDFMEHLPIHMAYEAMAGGPVQYRWMYPFERFLYHLKKKVKNKARVEGSIVSDYIVEETTIFLSHYFKGGYDGIDDAEVDRSTKFSGPRPLRPKSRPRYLDPIEYKAAHLFVLLNTQVLEEYQNKFLADIEMRHHIPNDVARNRMLESDFANWFESHRHADAFVWDVSFGPKTEVTTYDACEVNGFVFHTLDYGKHKNSYNSGVLVKGNHFGEDECQYYGQLLEVIELSYQGASDTQFVLFKCEWFDPAEGVRTHRKFNRLVEVNPSKKWHRNRHEPFVFASQAAQVYYCTNPSTRRSQVGWRTVIPMKARGEIDMDIVDVPFQEDTTDMAPIEVAEEEMNESLNDPSGVMVDVDMGHLLRQAVSDEAEPNLWHDSETEDEEDNSEDLELEDDDD